MFSRISLVAALALAAPMAAVAGKVVAPAVPSNLVVPEGNTPFAIAHAVGTQDYVCLPDGAGVKWTLFGPQATLFSDDGTQVATHFLSPNPAEDGIPRATWQDSRDSSATWAMKDAESDDARFVASGAIKWFRLHVVGNQYGLDGDRLANTTYVQRVNTSGG